MAEHSKELEDSYLALKTFIQKVCVLRSFTLLVSRGKVLPISKRCTQL